MAAEESVEESSDEIGKRIAAQWTTDPDAAGDASPSHEGSSEPVPDDVPDVQPACPVTEGAGSETEQPKSIFERLKGVATSLTTAAFGTSAKDDTAAPVDALSVEKAQAAVKELTEASKLAVEAHNAKSGELRDAEAKLKSAQQLLANVCSD